MKREENRLVPFHDFRVFRRDMKNCWKKRDTIISSIAAISKQGHCVEKGNFQSAGDPQSNG